jgi:hypothetical protein
MVQGYEFLDLITFYLISPPGARQIKNEQAFRLLVFC